METVHPRVLGYLGRALSLELSAVQQYMTQASLLALWGDGGSAERFRQETVEEMQHAERLVQQMLRLGVAPAASQLKPVSAARDLIGLLRLNIVQEDELIQHYAEANRFCLLVSDLGNAQFFHDLWQEESQHGDELEAWVQDLAGLERSWASQRVTF
ncbi:bacterioferritin [Synechococcus sp. CS-1329]|jgi:bacterioferritin|uniref:ferritin-like domain-containing protein n=1 Tax=Synechococcus sp. CS-1329 TaxID=2847975 RepID=UPI00223B0424|nr:ferritin-like domain-containing protein [Synechococcus sp. CS-1329]MCT0218208.1 bacterioferritin [Synechococcus sp. CS-1329]